MSRLSETFSKRKALITYITAGDPNLAATEKLVYALEKAGADIVELGIPFSDPLADGPIIQASHQRALKKDVSLAQVFKLVANVRKKTTIPICFMLSYNLVVKYGVDKFYTDCEKYGVDGVIVPDLPAEELPPLSSRGSDFSPLSRGRKEEGVDSIFLIAPTSTDERIKLAAERSSGFIYLISVAGITGKRQALADNLAVLVAKIKQFSKLPVAIGFGVSTPAQAAQAAKVADGVIVGSAIVDLIGKKKIQAVPRFVASLRKAIDAL
ncbi:MAG: tryptophan synthase subunit alpha [Candidatus Margulisiibacteriota bacterium]